MTAGTPTDESKPLQGRRIVVTRSRQQAGKLTAALQLLGAEVIELPLIEIIPPASYEPLDEALRHLEAYQWLIVTSANTARVLGERSRHAGVPLSDFKHPKIIAIGSATADGLREQGIGVDLIPEKYVAESVLQLLDGVAPGAKVLLARASVARDVISEELNRSGARVDIVDAYQTVLPAGSDVRAQQLFAGDSHAIDAVTFTSSSTVKHMVKLLAQAGIKIPPRGVRAISIGPVTSVVLRECGWPPAVEAIQSDIAGLVDAVVRLLGAAGRQRV
jgi:uroporphyrinogen-III synthase